MPRSRDAAKERYWKDVIRRQAASGVGIREYCDQAGVPEHRFHWWRRNLGRRDRKVTMKARADDPAPASDVGSDQPEFSTFVPVRLPFSLGGSIEVVHPRGYVIRVPSGFDASVLQRILSTLDSTSTS
jgi:hypothetical protein